MHAYFIDISQNSVERHLWFGRIYNNNIIVNCLQSVPVKEFQNRSITGKDMDKSKLAHFFGPPCTLVIMQYRDRQSGVSYGATAQTGRPHKNPEQFPDDLLHSQTF